MSDRKATATLLLCCAIGCPGGRDLTPEELKSITSDKLQRFSSEGEFDGYLARVAELRADTQGGGFSLGCGDEESAAAMAPADKAAPGGESITNNQEAGVDEGDIVKALGEHFVILRRGRLFSVRQSDLAPVAQLNAFPDGFTQGTWYDEMLVHQDRIVVVGFSYQVGATEIGLFRMAQDGRITHEATHFLRSNDYYSSRNYASRLVGSKLIFYMPYSLYQGWGEDPGLPSVRTWMGGDQTGEWTPVLSKVDAWRPIQPTLWPTLHTVVHCDLDSPAFACTARAVIGPGARTFYVSPEAVYIWVSPGYESLTWQDHERRFSFLYRMPILEGPVTALRTHGDPVDQFSFKEGGDGFLNVLLVAEGGGDAMWNPEIAQGDMALLRVPLQELGAEAGSAENARYTRLPRPAGNSIQNRFVGDRLLWGGGNGWWDQKSPERRVFVTSLLEPAAVHEVGLSHSVDRIEALGEGAVVVGGDGADLRFSALELGQSPTVKSVYTRPDAAQGETRSHGFFFRPDPAGGGVLGLPVRHEGEAWRHLMYGSAEVVYLQVDPALQLAPLGALAATQEAAPDDQCQKSCVDWYGNARPIFFQGRVLALMGYELVEGAIEQAALRETARVNFFSGAR